MTLPAQPTWPLPLDAPPSLVQAGFGRHGHQGVERYRLPSLWVLHLYDYTADLELDGRAARIMPGTVGLTPPGVTMTYRYRRPVTHHYVHFAVAPASGREGEGEGGVIVPAIHRPSPARFERWRGAVGELIAWRGDRPGRAAAGLWELLWRVADSARRAGAGSEARPTGERVELTEAKRLIERRMGRPLRIADLAAEVGLSHNHLTRLFREAEGCTAIEYLNRRRAERADHLLRQTTRPIKAVALELGMADLSHFNKFIRQRFGRSPRALRAEAGSPAPDAASRCPTPPRGAGPA